jgi:hypothetical protein
LKDFPELTDGKKLPQFVIDDHSNAYGITIVPSGAAKYKQNLGQKCAGGAGNQGLWLERRKMHVIISG